jgi:hypothetical protein
MRRGNGLERRPAASRILSGSGWPLAPAIFVAPATAMTLQMSVSRDASSGEFDCCQDGHANNNFCTLACLNVFLFAATAQHGNLVPVVCMHPVMAALTK